MDEFVNQELFTLVDPVSRKRYTLVYVHMCMYAHRRIRPRGYKIFLILNSTQLLVKTKIPKNEEVSCFEVRVQNHANKC